MTDNVNDPQHYQFSNGAQVIDITENLNFNRGNVVKYVARAGRKSAVSELEDLRKAQFYLEREISLLEKQKPSSWTLGDIAELRQQFWGSRELRWIPDPKRSWELLDNVPPNTIVVDKDGDRYRRINGTAKFQISYWRGEDEYSDWTDAPPFIYSDQGVLSPFVEVTG